MGLLDALLGGNEDNANDKCSSGEIDASSVLSLVGKLVSGDEESTGASSGLINPAVLMNGIGMLTGKKTAEKTDHEADKSSGLDGNMIMSLVSHLAKGEEKETGAKSGSINHGLLSGVLSAFTGKNGFNAGALANAITPLFNNADFKSDFMKNPVTAIEKVIGINLPDEKLQPVIDAIKSKFGGDHKS